MKRCKVVLCPFWKDFCAGFVREKCLYVEEVRMLTVAIDL